MLNRKFLITCALVVVAMVILLRPGPGSIKIPYPYKMTPLKRQSLKADAVWLGSEFAVATAKSLANLERRLESAGRPIKIENFSQNFLGLHRSLQILRSLDPFPKVIYYMGNSQEAAEFKFYLPDHEIVRSNLKLYSSTKFQRSIKDSGFYSNPFKEYTRVISLKAPQVNSVELKPEQKAAYLATLYSLYEMELKELILLVKKNNAQLVLVTTPLKLKDSQVENCGPIQADLQDRLSRLRNRVSKGEYQRGYQVTKGLLLKHKAVAELHYTHALIAEGLGHFTEALEHFNQSQFYNCSLYGAKPVFNNILRAAAKKYDIALFDFDNYLQEKFITSDDRLKINKIGKESLVTLFETLEYLTLK